MTVELREVAPGLWLWRQPHPDWNEGSDREPEVASFAAGSRGAAILLDPLALDFEHVRVSHGEPVHDRTGFEAALEREPWSEWSGA